MIKKISLQYSRETYNYDVSLESEIDSNDLKTVYLSELSNHNEQTLLRSMLSIKDDIAVIKPLKNVTVTVLLNKSNKWYNNKLVNTFDLQEFVQYIFTLY